QLGTGSGLSFLAFSKPCNESRISSAGSSALLKRFCSTALTSRRSASQTCSDSALLGLNFKHAPPSSCFGLQPFSNRGILASVIRDAEPLGAALKNETATSRFRTRRL
ncbi:MAG: hypothetical protein AB7F94_03655, partial [Nitrospira sp.]